MWFIALLYRLYNFSFFFVHVHLRLRNNFFIYFLLTSQFRFQIHFRLGRGLMFLWALYITEEPSQNLQLKIKCWSVSKVIRNSSDMNDPDKSCVWMILILTVFRRKYHFIIHYKGSIFRSQYQELDYAFISPSCTRINCPIQVITLLLKQHSASIVLSLSFCLAHW